MASVFRCPRSSPSTVFHTRRTERGIASPSPLLTHDFTVTTSFLICKTCHGVGVPSRAKASSGRCRLQSAPVHVPRDQTLEMQLGDHVLVRVCDGWNHGHLDVVQTERAVFICTCGISQQRQIPSTRWLLGARTIVCSASRNGPRLKPWPASASQSLIGPKPITSPNFQRALPVAPRLSAVKKRASFSSPATPAPQLHFPPSPRPRPTSSCSSPPTWLPEHHSKPSPGWP